jgi:DNA-binding NarL/FixJ family response regulator
MFRANWGASEAREVRDSLYTFEQAIRVPFGKMDEPIQRTEPAKPSPTSAAPKRILITDDNEFFLPVLRACLESQGYVVCGEAADGVGAIERAKELKPDLLILDMAMPRLNGMEAAAVLKNLMPRMPIVLLTIHDDEVNSVPTGAFGIRAVVSKSDGISKLTECLRSLLATPTEPAAQLIVPISKAGTEQPTAEE